MIRALHHVGVGVGDLARAREFFWNAFAFEMLPDGSSANGYRDDLYYRKDLITR